MKPLAVFLLGVVYLSAVSSVFSSPTTGINKREVLLSKYQGVLPEWTRPPPKKKTSFKRTMSEISAVSSESSEGGIYLERSKEQEQRSHAHIQRYLNDQYAESKAQTSIQRPKILQKVLPKRPPPVEKHKNIKYDESRVDPPGYYDQQTKPVRHMYSDPPGNY